MSSSASLGNFAGRWSKRLEHERRISGGCRGEGALVAQAKRWYIMITGFGSDCGWCGW